MGQVGWVQVMVRTEHAIMTQCPVIALGPSLLALPEGVNPTCVAKALMTGRQEGRSTHLHFEQIKKSFLGVLSG